MGRCARQRARMTHYEARVELTWDEVRLGAQVGCMRHIQCAEETRVLIASEQAQENLWANNLEGALAEMSAAKHLNLFWAGALGNYEAPDVGPYQVRCNSSRKYDDMVIRPRDVEKQRADTIYISVLAFTPAFLILGWKRLRDCMQERWYRVGQPNRPKCWFVPRTALMSLDDLPTPEQEAARCSSALTAAR